MWHCPFVLDRRQEINFRVRIRARTWRVIVLSGLVAVTAKLILSFHLSAQVSQRPSTSVCVAGGRRSGVDLPSREAFLARCNSVKQTGLI